MDTLYVILGSLWHNIPGKVVSESVIQSLSKRVKELLHIWKLKKKKTFLHSTITLRPISLMIPHSKAADSAEILEHFINNVFLLFRAFKNIVTQNELRKRRRQNLISAGSRTSWRAWCWCTTWPRPSSTLSSLPAELGRTNYVKNQQ